jgi:hypothetical protein
MSYHTTRQQPAEPHGAPATRPSAPPPADDPTDELSDAALEDVAGGTTGHGQTPPTPPNPFGD